MFRRFGTYLWFAFVVPTSVVLCLIALLLRLTTYPFDRRLRALHMFTCFWASLYTWIMPPWRIRVEGREKIRKDATYVVVSNHQSLLDILVAFRLFFHFKWVSKIEIFKLPLYGWNMSFNRYVKLKRGDKKSIEQMMAVCDERIAEGSSVFLFPEGTRSPDGNIKQFKLGAFILAHRNKVPILPIVISGTNRALPKYKLNLQGIHKILIRVFDEIPYKKFENLSVEDTAEMVRQIMIEKLEAMNTITAEAK